MSLKFVYFKLMHDIRGFLLPKLERCVFEPPSILGSSVLDCRLVGWAMRTSNIYQSRGAYSIPSCSHPSRRLTLLFSRL